MVLKVKQRLIQYLLSRKEEEGFTLVELIVVVMIIGILSSIAIPSFMNATEKARQQEASVLINAYLKAAQAYYLENGSHVRGAGDLAQYVSVIECEYHLRSKCSNENVMRDVGALVPEHRAWNSPAGGYQMNMSSSNNKQFLMRALPQAQTWPAMEFSDTGYGVSGCLNYSTGASKVSISSEKGHKNVKDIDC